MAKAATRSGKMANVAKTAKMLGDRENAAKTPKTAAKTAAPAAPAAPAPARPCSQESYPGATGLYIRHLAEGDRLYLRVRTDGGDRYRALDIAADAPRAAVLEAAEKARAAILNPPRDVAWYLSQYAAAKSLKPRSIVAFRQALAAAGIDRIDDEKGNAAAVAALQASTAWSAGTKRAYMQRIGAYFRWLRDAGEDVRNPLAGRALPKKSAPRAAGFDAAGVAALLHDLDGGRDRDLALFARLLRYTGARCSTIAAITPGAITPDGDGYRLSLVNIKSGRPYRYPLLVSDPDTCAMIRTKMARCSSHFWASSERLLHDRLARAMRRVLGAGATPHGLRHFRASEMLAAGVPLETISRILDHSSIGVTHEVYARQDQSAIDAAMAVQA